MPPSSGAYHAWIQPLQPPHHQVHARHPNLNGVILLDLLFTDLSRDIHYRRDLRVTLPLEQARRWTPDGLPYLTPEAALLFKATSSSGNPRSKDELDFQQVLPILTVLECAWLRQALENTSPGHPWTQQLPP